MDPFTFATVLNDRSQPSKLKNWIQTLKNKFKKDENPCQNATCPDGIVQLHSTLCNGQCPTIPVSGSGSFLCENFNFCRDEFSMCKGITTCGNDK